MNDRVLDLIQSGSRIYIELFWVSLKEAYNHRKGDIRISWNV